MNLFKQGIKQDATDSATLGINTRSFEVSNMSQYDLQINDPILNGYRLPAYSSKTFEATPGMTIDFRLVAPVINSNGATTTEYVQIAESPVALVTPVTPLALIPIYNLPITGNVTADISNANVPISGNVNATIQNASVPVSGSVAVSSGSIDATIQNATIDTSVTNAYVPMNELVHFEDFNFVISNLAAGSTYQTATSQNVIGLYDGIVMLIYSANYASNPPYTINAEGISHVGSAPGGQFNCQSINLTIIPAYYQSHQYQAIGLTPSPEAWDTIEIRLINNSSNAVNDTIYVSIFGIRSQVQINNPSSTPVNTKPVNGSPTASNVVNTTGGATTPLISSGGVIKKIYIGACASGGAFPNPCTLHVINGSANVAEFDVSGMVQYQWKTFELDFGDGIANSGISVYYGAVGTPPNGQATGYAIMQ